MKVCVKIPLFLAVVLLPSVSHAILTFQQAQELALEHEPGLLQLDAQARAYENKAMVSGQLPDPVLVIGAQNFPTDTFRFDQEPMTQLKVGIRQSFPAGNTLSLREEKEYQMVEITGLAKQQRVLEILREVRNQWFDVAYQLRTQRILEKDQQLFKQLLEVTRSLYSVGKVQQKDVLRAELELGRLHERIIKAERGGEIARTRLSRWVGDVALEQDWPKELPVMTWPSELSAIMEGSADTGTDSTGQLVSRAIARHPTLQLIRQQEMVANTDVELARQAYQPAWGVELNYGHRGGTNNNGTPRTDFLSAMVTISLPLFPSVRQDKSVQAASDLVAVKGQMWQETYRSFRAAVRAELRKLKQTEDQLALFDQEILTKARQQAEAALNAYQADAADFSEVMRAYLSEQKDRLDYENLRITRLKELANLHFYLPDEVFLSNGNGAGAGNGRAPEATVLIETGANVK